jgi:FAD/FMN-containing dehydrogenase
MEPATLQAFKQKFSGDIIVPGDTQYEAASTILAGKGSPVAVVRPRTEADVALAIKLAKDNKLILSVRSGGHSNAGQSTNNGGLVIDMQHFADIKVADESKRLVRVGPGTTWGAVAVALAPHGWAISSGDTRTVGVGGLALAGGIGWMVRKYGLALDSLAAVELITANGEKLRASESENAELFWGLRGGGGNFGVATAFEFTPQQVGDVHAGMIAYDFSDLRKALKGWRDYMRRAPEELTTMFIVLPSSPAFGNQPSAAIVLACYAGDDETAAKQAIDPLLAIGKVMHQDIKRKPYHEVLEEAHQPQDLKAIVNNGFFKEFDDATIERIAQQTGQILQIRSVGGAMNRVPADATAFAHRDSEVMIVAPAFVPPDATEDDIQTACGPWRAIAAEAASGAYVSFFSDLNDTAVHAAYPAETYQRLARLKAQYDPDDLFKLNGNIKPIG